MKRIAQKLNISFLTVSLLVILLATKASPSSQKYQIECTMCSACDNPCYPSPRPPSGPPPPSPPPPSPPPATGSNCPPPPSPPSAGSYYYYSPPPPSPPSSGSYYYYSPPPPFQPTYTYSSPPPPGGVIGGTFSPPPYKGYPRLSPPNPIVPYFPFYYYNPPPHSWSASSKLTASIAYTVTLLYLPLFLLK